MIHTFGLVAGIGTLLVIGLGFPLVIHGERLLGYRWWPYMLAVGILLAGASLFMDADWSSVLMGVLGATLAWGSTELKEQAVRAELGWFPFNPRKLKPPFEAVIARWKAPHL